MINKLFEWMINQIMVALSGWASGVLELVGTTTSKATSVFPLLASFETVFISIGYGFVALFAYGAIVRVVAAPATGARTRPAFQTGAMIVIAVAAVGLSGLLCDTFLEAFEDLFTAIIAVPNPGGFSWGGNFIGDLVGTNSGATLGLEALGILGQFILLLIFAYNYIKLLLQIVQRYFQLMFARFVAPVACSTLASETTLSVFSGWCRLFIGQLATMLLTAWGIRVLFGFNTTLGDGMGKLIYMIAWCNVLNNIEDILSRMGLEAVSSKNDMVGEMVMAGKIIKGGISAAAGSNKTLSAINARRQSGATARAAGTAAASKARSGYAAATKRQNLANGTAAAMQQRSKNKHAEAVAESRGNRAAVKAADRRVATENTRAIKAAENIQSAQKGQRLDGNAVMDAYGLKQHGVMGVSGAHVGGKDGETIYATAQVRGAGDKMEEKQIAITHGGDSGLRDMVSGFTDANNAEKYMNRTSYKDLSGGDGATRLYESYSADQIRGEDAETIRTDLEKAIKGGRQFEKDKDGILSGYSRGEANDYLPPEDINSDGLSATADIEAAKTSAGPRGDKRRDSAYSEIQEEDKGD